MTQAPFSSLKLSADILRNLASLNYQQMTPIQALSLPLILSGKDVIGQGKTGSGKTVAFSLGILNNLRVKRFRVQTLVLCPTRELADQVAQEIRKLARAIHNVKVLTLCGGVPIGPQIGSLEHGAHIVVGTPGRVEDHLRKGRLCLDEVNTLVLDEADRMLDMGFEEPLTNIVSHIPEDRQSLLFSATFPAKIQAMAKHMMHQPEMVKAEESVAKPQIQQAFYALDSNEDRLSGVKQLLLAYQSGSSVVFCNTKRETQELTERLCAWGFSAVALHGDLEQKERERCLVRFANKSALILVATDVAARGLDIEDLDLVINYQVAHDPEVHVHRVGRTGRADKKGRACTLFTPKEAHKLAAIEEYAEMDIHAEDISLLEPKSTQPMEPSMVTLMIDGGKKQKLRPGDILGALTSENGIQGAQVGKIKVFDIRAFVAIEKSVVKVALNKLGQGKMKGRSFKVMQIRR